MDSWHRAVVQANRTAEGEVSSEARYAEREHELDARTYTTVAAWRTLRAERGGQGWKGNAVRWGRTKDRTAFWAHREARRRDDVTPRYREHVRGRRSVRWTDSKKGCNDDVTESSPTREERNRERVVWERRITEARRERAEREYYSNVQRTWRKAALVETAEQRVAREKYRATRP